MNSYLETQRNSILNTLDLLDSVINNLDQFNNMNNKEEQTNFVTKLVAYGLNIETINENTMDLLKDITNNKSIISNETRELINDDLEVSQFINEIKPLLVMCFFNRKYLKTYKESRFA